MNTPILITTTATVNGSDQDAIAQDSQKLVKAVNQISLEYIRATSLFSPFNTAHEGYAVVLEEVDELWDEVKKSPKKREMAKMRVEAIQVAAMALRFVVDCCNE